MKKRLSDFLYILEYLSLPFWVLWYFIISPVEYGISTVKNSFKQYRLQRRLEKEGIAHLVIKQRK
jgi:hypothetical protein